MKTFTDNTGRPWSVAINVDALKRVKTLLDVNLLEVAEGKVVDGKVVPGGLLERLTSDPILLCDVIYAVCKPEADAKEISDEDFGRAMAGDAIDVATTALLEDLVDFFPQGRRQLLRKALGKLRKLESMAMQAAERKLDGPELERRMEKALAEIDSQENPAPTAAGGLSGNSQASAASNQAP